MNRLISFSFIPIVLLSVGCNRDNKPYKIVTYAQKITVPAFGNIGFDATQTDIEEAGINYGDTLEITLDNVKQSGNDYVIGEGGSVTLKDIPFVTNYNEAGYYAACLCNYQKKNEKFDLAFGLNRLKNHSQEMIDNRIQVTIKQQQKGGYDERLKLVYCPTKLSYEKVGYNNLVYSNFRDVTSIGAIKDKIKPGKFYRGSSPFNAKENNGEGDPRYLYADQLLGYFGITHELSLSIDNENLEAKTQKYPISRMFEENGGVEATSKTPNSCKLYGYVNSTTRGSKEVDIVGKEEDSTFLSLGLGSDYFYDTDTHLGKTMTQKAFKFIADKSDGDSRVYIHCNEGKDRTGFFAMVVEALCGVSYRDIVADFMCTFKNYFNFSRVDEEAKLKYDTMKAQTVSRHVYSICVDDPASVEWLSTDVDAKLSELGIAEENETSGVLQTKAKEYIKRIFGETEGNKIITSIQTNLGK